MRDDSRPTDAFAWVRPWVPYGDDPFVWYDPSEDLKRNDAPPVADDQPRRAPAAAEALAPAPVAPAESGDDMWVELPAVEDRPKSSRRGRGRGRGRGETVAEVSAEVIAETVEAVESTTPPDSIVEAPVAADPAPVGRKPRAGRAKAKPVEIAEAVAPEPPVLAVVAPAETPAPPAPREPDPAEIAAPPAAPRKGWWRRG